MTTSDFHRQILTARPSDAPTNAIRSNRCGSSATTGPVFGALKRFFIDFSTGNRTGID
jgi:hypothetical protein